MPATLRARAAQARGTLYAAPTTPYAARETFQARATRARATPDHGAVHGAQRPRQTCATRRSSSRARIRATQCESERSTTGAMGEGAASEPLPGASQDAVAAAIEDGATMDEIVACVRARGGDRSPSIPRARRCARARPAEGRWAERMDGLICLQRETHRFAEEWARAREPGAEGLSALIAIETLRTLALRTMADLSQRTEPVATEDLARLALALHRIEAADRLRVEREQAMADAAAHAGPAARAASMTHAERVETVRRALEGHVFPGRTDPPPPASGWAAASPADSYVTPPDPTPEPPADGGAHDVGDAGGAPDVCDPRGARDSWDAHRARDAELRRREAERRLWPTDPPFLPLGMERAGVRPGVPHPLQPNTRCRRHDHAMWSDRKDTPTSPQPSPPLIHFPQAPGARSASLAFAPCGARGRRGRTGGAVYVPSPPFRGERDRERWVCCLRDAVPQNPSYPTYPTYPT